MEGAVCNSLAQMFQSPAGFQAAMRAERGNIFASLAFPFACTWKLFVL